MKFHNKSIHSNIKSFEVIKRGLLSIDLVYYALVTETTNAGPLKT